MAKASHPMAYRRVRTGLGGTDSLGRQQSLWLGEDHLLVVDDAYFVRSVSRADLRDIEAVVTYPTRVYVWTTVGAGGLCLVGGSLCLGATFAWILPGLCLVVPCLLILLANLVRGPTCVCELQTRVASRRLRALGRQHQVERFLAQVRPLILAAQAGAGTEGAPAGPAPAGDPVPGVTS